MDICLQIHFLSTLDAANGYWAVCSRLFHGSTRTLSCGKWFFVLAILIYIVGWIFRTRCEFAVTNNRFIQKDGILNIRMTEIPLFKIETVNFYQSLGQRILGTGSIELVGSGGTFHRVNYVEKPLTVRRTIVCAINNNQNRE